ADALGIAPPLEIGIGIAAEDQEQVALTPQRFERIERERGTLPVELDARDFEARLGGGRRRQHREASFCARDRTILLPWPPAPRHELDPIQAEAVERRVGHREMPDVARAGRTREP